jgi:SAM-dependent methyltransferase
MISVHEFDWIARNVFAPVYPVIAGQIREKTGMTSGICLDLGCGGGYLSIALAGQTDLKMVLLDRSAEMARIAYDNVAAAGLQDRIDIIFADVHRIPLCAGSIDLVVSRGSVFFWEHKVAAFSEINRVLAPGGKAYIGGGMGTPALMEKITARMKAMNREMRHGQGDNRSSEEHYREVLRNAGFAEYQVRRDETGFWIEMLKNNEPAL